MLKSRVLGASLLIAGTAVGAGVLAVPLLVAEGGFFPSLVWYLVSWLCAIFSGYCVLEVITWVKDREEVNFASLTRFTLGPVGKMLFTSIYILFLYALLVAYFCEGGNLLFRIFDCSSCDRLSGCRFVGPIIFFGLMFFFVSSGIKIADYFNRILVVGLLLSFLLFCVLGFGDVKWNLLQHYSWRASFKGIPVIFLCFGYQLAIPSLFYYLDRKAKLLKKSILMGLSFPLVFYVLWNALVLGAVPLPFLNECVNSGHTAVMALKMLLGSPSFYVAGEFFAFFALTSSFIGVSLGFIDFLADELKWNKQRKKLLLLLLVFGLPLSFSVLYPFVALKCLHYAGGAGAVILTGVFPILMVVFGRRRSVTQGKKRLVPGGNITLLLLSVVIVFDFFVLIYNGI